MLVRHLWSRLTLNLEKLNRWRSSGPSTSSLSSKLSAVFKSRRSNRVQPSRGAEPPLFLLVLLITPFHQRIAVALCTVPSSPWLRVIDLQAVGRGGQAQPPSVGLNVNLPLLRENRLVLDKCPGSARAQPAPGDASALCLSRGMLPCPGRLCRHAASFAPPGGGTAGAAAWPGRRPSAATSHRRGAWAARSAPAGR